MSDDMGPKKEAAPVPASIRTMFLAAGGSWSVDEDVRTFVEEKNRFLAAAGETEAWFHADHRLICFDRKLLSQFVVAWTVRHDVQVVDEPSAVDRINRAARRTNE